MIKCDYCGKKIGIFSDYTWIEKGKRAIHNHCLVMQKYVSELKGDEKKMSGTRTFYKSIEKKLKMEKKWKNN